MFRRRRDAAEKAEVVVDLVPRRLVAHDVTKFGPVNCNQHCFTTEYVLFFHETHHGLFFVQHTLSYLSFSCYQIYQEDLRLTAGSYAKWHCQRRWYAQMQSGSYIDNAVPKLLKRFLCPLLICGHTVLTTAFALPLAPSLPPSLPCPSRGAALPGRSSRDKAPAALLRPAANSPLNGLLSDDVMHVMHHLRFHGRS